MSFLNSGAEASFFPTVKAGDPFTGDFSFDVSAPLSSEVTNPELMQLEFLTGSFAFTIGPSGTFASSVVAVLVTQSASNTEWEIGVAWEDW
jgi:hypothetical protein